MAQAEDRRALLLQREAYILATETVNKPEAFWKSIRSPSKRQYKEQERLWERFKAEIGKPHMLPDFPNLKNFVWWAAEQSKGRLAERADIKTLCWNLDRFCHLWNETQDDHYIARETIEEVKKFLATDVASKLGLQNRCYEKAYASWDDVAIMIRFIIENDPHVYRNNRFFAQIICLYLLVADDGERLGAIVRSDAYRDTEVALCYKDVRLLLESSSRTESDPEYRLEITYNNRKGQRDKGKGIMQTYHFEPEMAHSVLFWILVLAFLDDAFEDSITCPQDLFTQQNFGSGDKHIRFNSEMLSVPLFRRMEGWGSWKLSSHLPWTFGSVNNESKRIVAAAGFLERFTFYAIRRGMANALDHSPHASEAARKQLMCHQNGDDHVYLKNYQSSSIVIDSASIYRNRNPREKRKEILSMGRQRDTNIPKLSKEQLIQIQENDEELQRLLRDRKLLRCNNNLSRSNIHQNILACRRRRAYLSVKFNKELKDNYLDNPDRSRIQHPESQFIKQASRSELTNALYTNTNTVNSKVLAMQQVIVYCQQYKSQENKSSDPGADSSGEFDIGYKSDKVPGTSSFRLTHPNPELNSEIEWTTRPLAEFQCHRFNVQQFAWTETEDHKLLGLIQAGVKRKDLAQQFPNRSTRSVLQRAKELCPRVRQKENGKRQQYPKKFQVESREPGHEG